MSRNFHEQLEHEKVNPPSERSTGLVFAIVALIGAIIFRERLPVAVAALALATLIGFTAWLRPALLKSLNLLWFRLGMLMHQVVNPIVMLAMFALAIVPAGLIMQRFRDPLVKRRMPPGRSYWIDITGGAQPRSSMRQQF
ncbi:MAG: hypothetical protein R3D57_13685 [Hyphomicrobiaceae bacterium]